MFLKCSGCSSVALTEDMARKLFGFNQRLVAPEYKELCNACSAAIKPRTTKHYKTKGKKKTCLKCEVEFLSPDPIRIRICEQCHYMAKRHKAVISGRDLT